MRIAVDKKTINLVKPTQNYIYLFDKEPYEELLKLNMHCIYYKKCEFVDINLTDYDIECYKKAKPTDKDFDKVPDKINNKIGIIIPNFNYEHTLEKCLNSILCQTYTNYQIIVVDDVSTDNSVKIAKSKLKPPHKVIELKQKRLNGGSRNEGLLHLDKDVDYVFFIDSDDWLLNNKALEHINDKLQTKPDVLFIGLSQYKNGEVSTVIQTNYKDKYEAIKGWSGCGKIIKKSLVTRQECLYNEGTLKEDKNQHYKICFYMNTFKCLNEPLYVWNRENTKSVTTIRDEINWKTRTIRHYADALQFALSIKGKDTRIDRLMDERLSLIKREIDTGGDKQW